MKFFLTILFFITSIFALELDFSVGENGKSLDDNNTVLILVEFKAMSLVDFMRQVCF